MLAVNAALVSGQGGSKQGKQLELIETEGSQHKVETDKLYISYTCNIYVVVTLYNLIKNKLVVRFYKRLVWVIDVLPLIPQD